MALCSLALRESERKKHEALSTSTFTECCKPSIEARKDAKEYYMKLYGHIAILHELIRAYPVSIEKGKAEVFSFEDFTTIELAPKEIVDEFKKAYCAFLRFYVEKKKEGFEIFVSESLQELLIKFWKKAKKFYEEPKTMQNCTEIEDFVKLALESAECMEKLFGLKEETRWEKMKKRIKKPSEKV